MARSAAADRAKAKAKREKQLAIGLSVVLVLVLAIEGPKTLKMLHAKPSRPVVAAGVTTTPASTPAAAPATPATATPSAVLVSAVQPSVDPGQLRSFARFSSKDPFKAQVSATAPASPAASLTPKPAAQTKVKFKAAAVPPPTTAVISLNGEPASVPVATDFPTAGAVFDRVGAIFHLTALTRTSAKVTINGGSYASGQPALTLKLGKPVTLQNTADGTRYTLLLEPPGTPLPASTTGAPASTTTPASVVPSGSGG